jgi:hypothetical protein
MTKRRHTTNLAIILGISVVLMLFIFLLVVHHHNVPDRVKQDRSTLLSVVSGAAEQIKPAR